jgi:GDP-mannose 6-dehydrogenase
MKVSIFGLGYVGVVTSGCLARQGHEVIGVDVASAKVQSVSAGHSPIVEDQLGEIVSNAVASGRLRATTDAALAVTESDLAMICVGTPSRTDGSLDQRFLMQVVEQIGRALRDRRRPFHVVVRSTITPGTLRQQVIPALAEVTGRPAGDGYEVSFHPEFLREGSAVNDFYRPPKIVVGERAAGSGRGVLELYDESFEAPRFACPIELAEMVKYCDNLYHAVKVTFANEVGMFCQAHDIDSQAVMDIFCADTKLNISPRYLRPGFAFGGSCLPKDLRAFLSIARRRNIPVPMLDHVLSSNTAQVARALELIVASEVRRIGLYGIAFKPRTDDLRESPLVELAERLLGKGRRIVVYDENVLVARLVGGNRSFVDQKLPHLAELLVPEVSALDPCELIVAGHPASDDLVERWLAAGKLVIDLTGARSGQRRQGLTSIV